MDTIENIEGTLIQHGYHNNRIYLMQLDPNNISELIKVLDQLAVTKQYGKIFAKIPADAWPRFESANYQIEAVVPGMFNGRTEGLFIAKYIHFDRQNIAEVEDLYNPKRWTSKNNSEMLFGSNCIK